MNKCALYIPRPGDKYDAICSGYVDTLRHLGWKTYVCDPRTKFGCRELIEKHNITLIMTHSRYGVRQLPVDTINDNNVVVFVEVLPINSGDLSIDGPYEVSHQEEPRILSSIKSCVVHTSIEKHLWLSYMSGWCNSGFSLRHVPVAGNLLKATPPTCDTVTDVAMVANFSHRQNVMAKIVEPLFSRLTMLNHPYQAFGDEIWHFAGLQYNGPLANKDNILAHIYASANVCPNVHTEHQVTQQAYLNGRSFMIPLCGGTQVSDNPLAKKYLLSSCRVATSITDFISQVVDLASGESFNRQKIEDSVKHVAENHTYFNRLAVLFDAANLGGFSEETKNEGHRAAIKHCWTIGAMLSAKERGVKYEQTNV